MSHCVSACADAVSWLLLLLLSVDVSLESGEAHHLLSAVEASSVESDVPLAPPPSFPVVTPDFLLSFRAAVPVLPVSFRIAFLGSPLSSHAAAAADAQPPLELREEPKVKSSKLSSPKLMWTSLQTTNSHIPRLSTSLRMWSGHEVGMASE